MRKLFAALGVCCVFVASPAAQAESDVVFSIIAGEPEWMVHAAQIARQLDHENGLRILPVLGAGGVLALSDLLIIPDLDAAIVSSDSLAYAKMQNLIADPKSVSYIAKLAPLELVLIARTETKNITALAGKRIATGPAQSAGFASGEIVFGALEIPFLRVPQHGNQALAALLAGQADAALVLGTSYQFAQLNAAEFHLLSLPLPPSLQKIYQPALLNARTFPGLIANGKTVETVSTSLTLAVQNKPRSSPHFASIKQFETELLKIKGATESENLAADILGWNRHAAAQDMLDQPNSKNIITPTGGEP